MTTAEAAGGQVNRATPQIVKPGVPVAKEHDSNDAVRVADPNKLHPETVVAFVAPTFNDCALKSLAKSFAEENVVKEMKEPKEPKQRTTLPRD